jgi:hypothetical protein
MQEEIIFGVIQNSGVSTKTGKAYDFLQALVGVAANGAGTKGKGYGLMQRKRNITKDAFEKLCKCGQDFPIQCEVQYSFDDKERLVIADVGIH